MARRAQHATNRDAERRPTLPGNGGSHADAAAVRLALAHLDRHGHGSLPAWSDGDLAAFRGGMIHVACRQFQQAEAVAALGPAAAQLVAGIRLVTLLAVDGPFGPAWAGHAFASDGFRDRAPLREPDLTGELAHLMGPSAGRRGAERARSFLRILADLTGAEALGQALSVETRPAVTAEHAVRATRGASRPARPASTASRRRLDLLFEWSTGEKRRHAVVAVEVKLGAAVSEGQLRPYAEAARRRAHGGPVALVLLTATPDDAERRNRSWRPVRWFALLRRWEAVLAAAGDTDPAFARLRARLWRYLLAYPGALQ